MYVTLSVYPLTFFVTSIPSIRPGCLSQRVKCRVHFISITQRDGSDRLFYHFVSGSRAFIFVRKTLQVLSVRSKGFCLFKLHRKDLRFSMKMMLAAGFANYLTACLNCYESLTVLNKPDRAVSSFLHCAHT